MPVGAPFTEPLTLWGPPGARVALANEEFTQCGFEGVTKWLGMGGVCSGPCCSPVDLQRVEGEPGLSVSFMTAQLLTSFSLKEHSEGGGIQGEGRVPENL